MRKNSTLWVVALVVTLISAVYQRMTGPSYPVRGVVTLGGQSYSVRLERTQVTTADLPIRLAVPDPTVTGDVRWRRYPTSDPYQSIPLQRNGERLEASLPRQPAAGKIEYQVLLRRGVEQQLIPPRPAVARFKNPESITVLVPHILAMFLAMLFSTRAGLAAVMGQRASGYTWLTLACLVPGGFVLGPIMQHQAFGDYWTGVPFGFDLTDNKTLIALVAWLLAGWTVLTRRAAARWAVAGASVVMLLVFMIPHSVWGSEIRWDQPASTVSQRRAPDVSRRQRGAPALYLPG